MPTLRTPLAAALCLTLTPLAAMAEAAPAAGPQALVVHTVRAADPPHCMAAGQATDPLVGGPLDLFDGRADQPWVLCPEAAAVQDYAIDFTFAQPIQVDGLRLEPGPKGGNTPAVVELGLHNRALSTRWPVHFRQAQLTAGPAVMAFTGRLQWNPQLVNDEGFHERRRAQGLHALDMPLPLTLDKLTVVIRQVDPKAGPVQLGELTFMFQGKPVAVQGLAAAKARHAAFLGKGLTHVLARRFLVGEARTAHLADGGEIRSMPTAQWTAGGWADAEARTLTGRWQVVDGRLEMSGPKGKRFVAVDYLVDAAPERVVLRSGPLAGTWRVASAAPNADGVMPPQATVQAAEGTPEIPLY